MVEQIGYWTTKQLSEAPVVDQSRIRQMLLKGQMKGFKIGRDWLIPGEEAQRYLAEREKRKKKRAVSRA
jgi:hypothetical protein